MFDERYLGDRVASPGGHTSVEPNRKSIDNASLIHAAAVRLLPISIVFSSPFADSL